LYLVIQRPQSAGDRPDGADAIPEEDCSSQRATDEDVETIPLARGGATQMIGLRPAAGAASSNTTTTHAAPVPAATAFIAQWKPAITQAWIN